MTYTYIAILALIQGLTEFLPVSSSGHLVLVPLFLGEADQGLVLDVALHMGTLSAILVYYWRDVWKMAFAVLFWRRTKDVQSRNLGLYIVLATIPAVLFGFIIKMIFPEGIRSVAVITATTLFFGLLMGIVDLSGGREREMKDITLKRALLIGCAQALALIPGTSRSGITITAARFLGFNRVDAARFSFLLGMPAMAGAGFMALLDMIKADDPGLYSYAAAASVMAFFSGLAAIHFMMRWLAKFGLMPFVIYRMFLGGFLLVYFIY